MRMGECKRYHTTFVETSYAFFVFACEALYYREPRCMIRGLDILLFQSNTPHQAYLQILVLVFSDRVCPQPRIYAKNLRLLLPTVPAEP